MAIGAPVCCGNNCAQVFCVSSKTKDTNCATGCSLWSRAGSGWLTALPEDPPTPNSEKRFWWNTKLRIRRTSEPPMPI